MDLDLNDASVTKEKVLELIKEFRRNHLSKGNVNLSDSDKGKDKFANMELGKLFRICCFKGWVIKVLPKHLNLFELEPIQLFMLD